MISCNSDVCECEKDNDILCINSITYDDMVISFLALSLYLNKIINYKSTHINIDKGIIEKLNADIDLINSILNTVNYLLDLKLNVYCPDKLGLKNVIVIDNLINLSIKYMDEVLGAPEIDKYGLDNKVIYLIHERKDLKKDMKRLKSKFDMLLAY